MTWAAVTALAIAIVGWTAIATAGWQTITIENGLTGSSSPTGLLEDRSGNLWVWTAPGGGVSRYNGSSWRTFTVADGLGGNFVTAMFEDRSGNIWVGTGGGVSRYDGQHWRTFTVVDGLGSDFVTAILEDRAGNFWVGTGGGVSRYDGQHWRAFPFTTPELNAMGLLEDRSGNIWVSIWGGGVSRYDGQNWRSFTAADGLGGNFVTKALLEDRTGNLWVGTDGGASRYDGQRWRTFTTADGLGSDHITCMFEDHSGILWFGTLPAGHQGGVSRYDGQDWSFSTGLGSTSVTSITGDNDGNLWVGTTGGVSRFDGLRWRTFTTADGLGSSNVFSVVEGPSEDLWVVSDFPGVSHFDGSEWRTFDTNDGLASTTIGSMIADRGGNLWAATNGGVSEYLGQGWRTFTIDDGLASNYVTCLLEAHSGNLWAGTYGGASRYDGLRWTTFTTTDGLGSGFVRALVESREGTLWAATEGGVSRYDGSVWRTFTTADGLGSNDAYQMLEDRSGNLWVGTYVGVSRYDGLSWRNFTTNDGLADNIVYSILEDRMGTLWFGTYGGVSRYDGQNWRSYTTDDGLASNHVICMLEDQSGTLWAGTEAGVSRYEGQSWRSFGNGAVSSILEDRAGNLWTGGSRISLVSRYDGTDWRGYTSLDGLGPYEARPLLEDHAGSIWFGSSSGATRYDPDRVAPRTVFVSGPPAVTAATTLSAGFVAAFGEALVQFSSRLDSLPWSPWSSVGSWTSTNLLDGRHTLQIRARDREGNIERTPAIAGFVVDATPPAPVIEAPTFGQALRGTVDIQGTAADTRFTSYAIAVRLSGTASWNAPDAVILAQSTTQVGRGLLASWDTNSTRFPDGLYDLRLSVADSLGLSGNVQVTVAVDNHFPFADETSPAVVRASSGGHLYTTNQELHLYFAPHAFDQDALVSVQAASTPDTLPSGATRVLPGHELSWPGGSLRKAATLDVALGNSVSGGPIAVYWSADGNTWERLGGTVDDRTRRVELSITQPGRYALFAESGVITGSGTLAGLAFTPRVFSPTGGFAGNEVGISFTLGRPAPVTVRVYSRSGRLIREVIADQTMNAGANLVRWDGRDRNGGYAADGMYLVTVEALGRTERKTLAVVK